MRGNMRRIAWMLMILVFAAIQGLYAQGRAGIPVPQWQGDSITSPRPLSDVADVLEQRYAKPVTYEDPVWEASDDVTTVADMVVLRSRTTSLPHSLSADKTVDLDAAILNSVLAEYDNKNDAPRFRVAQSGYGLHIIPVAVRDASGRIVPGQNPFDAVISVRTAKRTATAHLEEICAAVSVKSRVDTRCSAVGLFGDWYEKLFAAPGGAIEWGVSAISGRDALIDLLSHSATTFTWRYYCPAAGSSAGGFCVLNLLRIRVSNAAGTPGPATRTLEYDRCPQCARQQQNPVVR